MFLRLRWRIFMMLMAACLPSSGAVTWNPDVLFQKVKAVEGSSSIFAWNITFDNTNTGIFRVDIERVNSANSVLEPIIYRVTSEPNVTVPESSYKHREMDLHTLYHTPSNTAKVVFTLHNVNYTVDNGQKFKATVVFSPKFLNQFRSADLEVRVPPTITDYSCQGCEKGSAVENQTITLLCTATGNPSPNITWMKNGEPYSGSDSGSVSGNMVVFQKVSVDDKGNYTCIADNGVANSDNKSLTLLVKYKPKNTTLFSSNDGICKDASITLSCTADAYPPVNNYSLFNGNIHIGSNTDGQFSITAISLGRNRFCCFAKNEIGDSQCAYFDVYVLGNVNATYKINDMSKTAATVIEGERVVLKSDISGDGSYYLFTWSKINDSLPSHVKNDTRQLTFDSINRTDEGAYQVTLRDKENCSSQTRSFHLTVNYKPENTSIKIAGDKKTFCEGQFTQVNCMAHGKPAPIYSLYRYSEPLNTSRSGVFDVELDKKGYYTFTCVPKNTVGAGPNKSDIVTVKEPPGVGDCKVISSTIINGYVIEKEKVTLTCNNITGSEPRTITWSNGGHNLPNKNKATLTFDAVDRTHDGYYQMTVSNGNECKKAKGENLTLPVYYKPEQTRIQFSPNVSTVNEGEDITMTCKAEASPKPYYLWVFKGQMLHSDVNDTISLTNITAKDAGEYMCTAVNDVGRSPATKTLSVNYMREPTCEAVPVTVKEEANITLNCSVAAYPPANYTWKIGELPVGNKPTITLPASRDLRNKFFTCTAGNLLGSKNCSTTRVNVVYFDKAICSPVNPEWVPPINTIREDIINTTGFGNPDPYPICWSAQDGHKGLVSLESQSNSTYKMKVNTTVSKEKNIFICRFSNGVDNCYRNFTILKRVASFRVKYKVKLLDQIFQSDLQDSTTPAFIILRKRFISMVLDIYKVSEKEYLINVYVISFGKGSVWVNFELELIAKVTNPLQPLRNAVIENNGNLSGLTLDKESLSEGFYIPTTTPPKTTPFTSRITPTPSTSLDLTIIIIIVIAVIVVLIVVFIGIYCYCKKQRENRKNSTLVEVEDEVIIMEGRRNDGFSPSQYAQSGPPHISDPAYDSVDGVKKNAKDKNDNQAQPEKETEEPAYAAVDRSKKKKKQDELLYADLGDFQKNGDRAGGRGGLVLEPLPKGKDTKMPEKYQETIYADIDWKKKPAVTSNTDGPLADMHGQDAEADKDKTADSTKQNDQKPATVEKDKHGQCADAHKEAQPGESKPPDKTANPPKTNDEKPVTGENVKPPTKDESEKAFVQNHPAESLRTMNDRDNTTLTTVSL